MVTRASVSPSQLEIMPSEFKRDRARHPVIFKFIARSKHLIVRAYKLYFSIIFFKDV